MGLRQKLGGTDVEEEAREHREHPAKNAVGDRQQQPDDHAGNGRQRHERDPPTDLVGRRSARQQEADDPDAVTEAVDDNHDGNDQAQATPDGQAGREGDAVEEAVEAHADRADQPDVAVLDQVVVELGRGLVTDVNGGQLLRGVERQEAEGGEDHRQLDRSAEVRDALGNEVEERGTDANSGSERDHEADVADRAHRQQAAREGGNERAERHEGGRHRDHTRLSIISLPVARQGSPELAW